MIVKSIKGFGESLSANWTVVPLTPLAGFSVLMGLVMTAQRRFHTTIFGQCSSYHSHTSKMHYPAFLPVEVARENIALKRGVIGNR